MYKRLIITLILCLTGISAARSAAIVYVDADARGSVHNGSSWATAYTSISQALSSSPNGAEVWIAEGTYRESIAITNYRRVYGGFAGYETSLSQRLAGAFRTIIDAGGKGRGIDIAVGVYSTIDGITIRNGRGDKGAGIYCHTNTTTQIVNCRVENCRATQWAGGIYMATYTYGNIVDCVITGNRAPKGGGIYVEYHSYPVVRNCLIVRNHAKISGGGIFGPYHAGPDFENCTIAYNSAEVNGGGVYDNYGSPMILNYCIIAFNSAPAGGGLFGEGVSSALTYSHCDLYGNNQGDIGGTIVQMPAHAGNIYADPLFLMPERDEFRLRSDSPCAGIGVYPIESPCSLDRIGIAKLLPDGTPVKINKLVVSAVDGGAVYLQAPDRSAAIAVEGLTGRHTGDLLASVTGILGANAQGVKVLSATSSVLHAAEVYTPEPLGATLSTLRSTTGLRAKTWGRVTGVSPGGFTLDDSIPVRWTGTVQDGSLVSATGVYTLNSDILASEVLVQQHD